MAEGTQLPPQLIRFWSNGGKGGALIRWGEPNDFYRCKQHIQEAVTKDGGKPLGDAVISGLCASLHKINTGAPPGHAVTEQMGRG